jgi:hypothetical protein
MDAHLLAVDNIGDVFFNKSPAVCLNHKPLAWTSNQMLPPDSLFDVNGEALAKTDLILFQPSSEEWDDLNEYIDSLLSESSNFGDFKNFILKYFQGSWYSLSHQYNFRERFVVFGSKLTFGLPAYEQPCKVICFREFIKPSDIFFFGESLIDGQTILPEILRDVITKVDSWIEFPSLAPHQSANDRCFALYRCWFETFFSLTERMTKSLGIALFEVVRPVSSFPIEQFNNLGREAYEARLQKKCPELQVRKFHLGRKNANNNDNRIKVTDTAVVTRFRMNAN